jgi:tetratricopeptide (TPR) repeat protein
LLAAQTRAVSSRPISAADQISLKRALDAYDQGDLKTSEPLLADLAVRYPRSYQANEALGSLYAETDRTDLALPYLRRACVISPREAIAHANLGAVYLKLNEPVQAIPELRLALKSDPHNAATQSNLGQALMLNEQPVDAARAFAAASALQPADSGLKYNLALALYDGGSIKEAAAALDSIPTADATDQSEALGGDIDERLGKFEQAVAHYQAAAKMNPSDANLYALTLEMMRHWTWDEAIAIASFGATRYPGSTHFEVAKGISEYGGGKYPEAIVTLSKLLQRDPENALFADLLGRSCSAIAEDTSAECSGLAEFAHLHPENAQAATYAAVSLLHRPAAEENKPEVKRLLDQAIAANPNLPEAYFQLGVLEQSQMQWKESVAPLKRALELRPTYPEAHYRLSRAYAHLGMKDEAQQEIALQQKYSQQAKDAVNAHLQEVVTFLVKSN